jgi:hypothetical protein
MRRGFSIFLILFFGLGPLSAFLDGSEDASLPPCCRRHRAHHCATATRMAAMVHLPPDPRPAFNVPLTCPNYPGLSITILMPSHAVAAAQASPHIALVRAFVPVAGHTAPSSSPSRAHAGRGPPATTLS